MSIKRDFLRRAALAAALGIGALTAVSLPLAPAEAHGWKHGWYYGPTYVARPYVVGGVYFAPPAPVYYAPAPVYYAPPPPVVYAPPAPVYYGPPSLSFGITLPLH